MSNGYEKRVPSRDECVLRYRLEEQAAASPNEIFIKMPGGVSTTYSAFHRDVVATAAGLAATGVAQGDMVASWLPNSLDTVRIWFAINWLGAVYVPINTAYKGQLLAHVLNDCGAKLLITHGDLIERLDDLALDSLETIIVATGDCPASSRAATVLGASVLHGDAVALPPLKRPIEPWDVQSIIYTSGTTGPSKGVISSYAHLAAMGGRDALPMFGDDEILLVAGPLFHASGTMPVYAMLLRGATAVLLPSFSTTSFWPIVRETGATATIMLGVMASFLGKEPSSADDRNHSLRTVMLVPLPDDWETFADRFGLTAYTVFNMSETSVPICSAASPPVLGTCGVVRAGVDARIVDEHDCEVPVGNVGELILRTDAPWAMNSGYLGKPEATLAAWRNGWFHTGDAFRRDAAGNYFFVDRMKDAIRRRGENISSFEVETEILMHPDIRECAVVAVPSESSEDEVLAIVAARDGRSLDPEHLHEFLCDRLAHFMVPRYIRVLESLPRTPTEKVEKHVLRAQGITADCWDREVAGIRVRRERLEG